jgi:hypothetical protein
VETPAIKVIGQLRKTPWQRFARLQRTAAKLAPAQRRIPLLLQRSLHHMDGETEPERQLPRVPTDADLVSLARELNRCGVAYVVVVGFALRRSRADVEDEAKPREKDTADRSFLQQLIATRQAAKKSGL